MRFDIQLLRGLAVLSVVLYHGFQQAAPHGFLGVDVFFVISGFLITRMILTQIADGSFSLKDFYLRRARRILPALLVTLSATAALAPLILTSSQWREFVSQVAGALTFTANFVLWTQGGYFDSPFDTRPLLHLWSLAVEEQFYLLFPIAMLLLPKRVRVPALWAGMAVSAMLWGYAATSGNYDGAAFYLLPTRGWQLLLGSLCALTMLKRPGLHIPMPLKLAALAVVIAACSGAFSLRNAAAPTAIATAVMMLGRDGWLADNWLTRLLGWFGDRSYSLYLVHWPLLAFAMNLYAGPAPNLLVAGLLLVSIVLAALQYRWIEQPFRNGATFRHRFIPRLAAPSVVLVLGSLALPAAAGSSDVVSVPPLVRGLAEDCGLGWASKDQAACRTSDRPRVAVWGDSFAMHLVPGLASSPAIRRSLIQFTMPSCTPILNVARPANGNVGHGPQCVDFNRAAFTRIVQSPNIKVVVLGSTWDMVSSDVARPRLIGDKIRIASRNEIVEALINGVRALRANGKIVMIVGRTPKEVARPFDPPTCNLRELEHRPLLRPGGCTISLADYRKAMPKLNETLQEVARRTGAPIFLPDRVLCDNGACQSRAGRTLLYADMHHLSEEGSKLVIRRMGLAAAVERSMQVKPPQAGARRVAVAPHTAAPK